MKNRMRRPLWKVRHWLATAREKPCKPDVNAPESVYFFTFHKCASTLFSRFVLKRAVGLCHVDYARQIYAGKITSESPLQFTDTGYIYGPIRLSASEMSPVYKALVLPVTEETFIRDKTAIFLVRDPRDILVSAYYSFGFTHGFSPVESIRKMQEQQRHKIQKLSLDEYALQFAESQAANFRFLYRVSQTCKRSVVLRYEDMVNDFDYFVAGLKTVITLDDATIREMYQRTRPRKQENVTSHRRSGRTGGFREKLHPETIQLLNRMLHDALVVFGYDE